MTIEARLLRRFFLRAGGAAVVVILIVLCSFRSAAALRESKSRHDAAPATGHFIRAGDVEMFVQEAGPPTGEPVILIHGAGAWSEIWRGTMNTLAANGFRAIALDLPPFGYSERPVTPNYGDSAQALRILGALDDLHLTTAILVGHSFGARPALEAALLAPTRVTQLVLVDPALAVRTERDAPARVPLAVRLAQPEPIRNGLVAATLTNPLLTKHLLDHFIARHEAATPDRVRMLQQPFAVAGTTTAVASWVLPFVSRKEQSLIDDPERLRAFSTPVLLLWGGRDEATPLPRGIELARLLPNAELRIVVQAGHIPAIEDPPSFNAALIRYLTRPARHRVAARASR